MNSTPKKRFRCVPACAIDEKAWTHVKYKFSKWFNIIVFATCTTFHIINGYFHS